MDTKDFIDGSTFQRFVISPRRCAIYGVVALAVGSDSFASHVEADADPQIVSSSIFSVETPASADTVPVPIDSQVVEDELLPSDLELESGQSRDESEHPFWQVPTTRSEWHSRLARSVDRPSWRSRPFTTSYLAGAFHGEHLERGHFDQGWGGVFIKRFGWDFANCFGTEFRFAEAFSEAHDITGQLPTNPCNIFLSDFDMVWYPFGDTRVRPYTMTGLGIVNLSFTDHNGHQNDTLVGTPFGMGCKYLWNKSLVFRVEVVDNLAIGHGQLSSMNNLSFAAGAELRIGNLRRHFLPCSEKH